MELYGTHRDFGDRDAKVGVDDELVRAQRRRLLKLARHKDGDGSEQLQLEGDRKK
jgi:hypothetical protein